MAKKEFEIFLDNLETVLPEFLSDKDLVKHIPEIFRNPSQLSRLRAKNQGPSHIRVSSARVKYLREDVLQWLREHYYVSATSFVKEDSLLG